MLNDVHERGQAFGKFDPSSVLIAISDDDVSCSSFMYSQYWEVLASSTPVSLLITHRIRVANKAITG